MLDTGFVGSNNAKIDPHRWSFEIVHAERSTGAMVDNPLQVVSLSKSSRLEDSAESTTHVCISLSSIPANSDAPVERWTPTCFSVHDTRWRRNVVSIGTDPDSLGTDVQITGWSRLQSARAAITWHSRTLIGPYRAVDVEDRADSSADTVSSIESELVEHSATYSAQKYIERNQLFRILSPKHGFNYPPGTTQLKIKIQVIGDIAMLGGAGNVCTSLEHVPTSTIKKACFPVNNNVSISQDRGIDQVSRGQSDVEYVWSNDYADIGSLTGEFVFQIFGVAEADFPVLKGARSRFSVMPKIVTR